MRFGFLTLEFMERVLFRSPLLVSRFPIYIWRVTPGPGMRFSTPLPIVIIITSFVRGYFGCSFFCVKVNIVWMQARYENNMITIRRLIMSTYKMKVTFSSQHCQIFQFEIKNPKLPQRLIVIHLTTGGGVLNFTPGPDVTCLYTYMFLVNIVYMNHYAEPRD